MRVIIVIAIWAAIITVSTPASAQIEVLKSGGTDVRPDKDTEVEFRTGGENVTVFEILAKSQSIVSAYGGGVTLTGSGAGQTTRRICDAPCTLKLKGGEYTLQVGEGLFFGEEFNVRADGVTKVYEVEDWNAGAPIGMVLGILGTGTAIGLPLSVVIVGDDGAGPLLLAALVSAGVAVVGWIWMIASMADVEQVAQ